MVAIEGMFYDQLKYFYFKKEKLWEVTMAAK